MRVNGVIGVVRSSK